VAKTGSSGKTVAEKGNSSKRAFKVAVAKFEPSNTDDHDVQSFSLLADWSIVLRVDHRFALGRPALLNRSLKKSFSSVNSPNLRGQRLHVDGRLCRSVAAS
jgi:hypothetical protein